MNSKRIEVTRQYLTFTLGEVVFAVDVTNVREILEFTKITRVPGTPDFMRGIINLRGSVVPVIDMRLKFGMSETVKSIDTCIVVIEVSYEGEGLVIGVLTDSVREVFELEPENIEEPPRIGTELRTEFIKGMGKKTDSFVIILDVDRIFSVEELTDIGGPVQKELSAVNG